MKTPAFWSEKNFLSTALLPLASAYEIISALQRFFIKPVTLPVPVICVGGLTAGGAGKTPVALHIGKLLKERNIPAFFLSRGYGGKAQGPLLVDPAKHNADMVGDEPLLLAKVLPVVVSGDRAKGAQLAIANGAKAIIMDDGFQNPSIAKTLSLVVIDGQTIFGNGRIIPAGPLRERPENGFTRSHAAIVINRTTVAIPLPEGLPTLFVKTQTTTENVLRSKKMLAFCGIATPKKFFSMLTGLGVSTVETIAFPDHYLYTQADWRKLVAKANTYNVGLVTTAKDAIRLPPVLRQQVSVVDITLEFENPSLLDAILDFALKPNEET